MILINISFLKSLYMSLHIQAFWKQMTAKLTMRFFGILMAVLALSAGADPLRGIADIATFTTDSQEDCNLNGREDSP